VRDANLGIAIQYHVSCAAFITKRISSTLQQTSSNQMLILMQTFPCNVLMCVMLISELHFNIAFLAPHSLPSAIQCLSHVPQPAIIAHHTLSISHKFAFSIINHLMQALHFASMNAEVVVYAEGRRKMKKLPRTRPSSAHLYLTSAHTS
jgi:hypothetical protein